MERSDHFGKIVLDVHRADEIPVPMDASGLRDSHDHALPAIQ
jgi:hypothetical protein